MDTINAPELSAQRAERIAELEMLGLEINIIEPEIFGDGVIEIRNIDSNPDWEHQFSFETIRRIIENWGLFEAVAIRNCPLLRSPSGWRHLSSRGMGYTQDPHKDSSGADVDAHTVVLTRDMPVARGPKKTMIMPRSSVEKALAIAQERMKIRLCLSESTPGSYRSIILKDYLNMSPEDLIKNDRTESVFAYGLKKNNKNDTPAEYDVLSAVPHWIMDYGPYDTLIINQNGPVDIYHNLALDPHTKEKERHDPSLVRLVISTEQAIHVLTSPSAQ